jgi:hypothetical protein
MGSDASLSIGNRPRSPISRLVEHMTCEDAVLTSKPQGAEKGAEVRPGGPYDLPVSSLKTSFQ